VKSNIAKVRVPCCLCNSREQTLIARGREHEYTNTTDDIFSVVKCRQCGLLFLNPRPAETEFSTIYPDEYPAFVEEQAAPEKSALSGLKEMFVDRLGYPSRVRAALRHVAVGDRSLRILDVGCGAGRVLTLFKQYHRGPIETVGLDFDRNATMLTRSKGHAVIQGAFEDADIPPASFDCVYSSHVIEHVADPKVFLRKVKSILKPGGLLFCETPNVGSIEARLLSRLGIWGGFHFPRHWTFFTPRTLHDLAQSTGLEVVETQYYMIPIFWIWSLHLLTFKVAGRKIADLLFPPLEHDANPTQLFLLTSVFTVLDMMIFTVTRQTACMFVILKNRG
jgi:2-polyprenyl-3-methyl-5-hydroxy-6-metoxy-1,4-benzoquinol methylase